MRVESHDCYILHKRPYRETSLLLEVFSRFHGRVGLIARGARQSRKSQNSALIQPFRPLLISWSGRGELGNMIDVEPGAQQISMAGTSLMAGFYVNELVMRLLHRFEAHEKLFSAYADTIHALAGAGSADKVLRLFEKDLLEATGYGLSLSVEAGTGNTISPDSRYEYISEHGPELLNENSTPAHVTVSGATLIALNKRALDTNEVLREAKFLLRQEMALRLGDKPLNSRALYQSYIRNSKSS